jgi:hypothetical protein
MDGAGVVTHPADELGQPRDSAPGRLAGAPGLG